MLLTDETYNRLVFDYGVELADPTHPAADVALRVPDWPSPVEYRVKRFPEPLRPAVLHRVLERSRPMAPVQLLLTVPAATDRFLHAAIDECVSVIVSTGEATRGHLIGPDNQILRLTDSHSTPAARRPGRVPWATFAVAMDRLWYDDEVRQVDMAHRLGISQASVSKSLRTLMKITLDTAVSDGQSHTSWRDRVQQWLQATYPRNPRAATSWLTLDSPNQAARNVSDLLTQRGIRHAVSGQVAADEIAPWERPRRALIWAEQLTDLTDAGATPAPSDEATLVLAVPEDPHMLDSIEDRQLPTLSPVRIWVDLVLDGDEEAAEVLQRHASKEREV